MIDSLSHDLTDTIDYTGPLCRLHDQLSHLPADRLERIAKLAYELTFLLDVDWAGTYESAEDGARKDRAMGIGPNPFVDEPGCASCRQTIAA